MTKPYKHNAGIRKKDITPIECIYGSGNDDLEKRLHDVFPIDNPHRHSISPKPVDLGGLPVDYTNKKGICLANSKY